MPATLAYWNIHGLAEPIRMLLEYTGEPYEDKRYAFGATPETMRKEWLDEKFKLCLDFPNLPYFIDGDVRMTQSAAIMRYIARKHDLLGATEKDRIRTDVCEQQCVDFRNGFGRLIMGGNQEKDRADYVKALPDKFRELDAFLGGKFEWFGGSKITFVDFLMYSMLRVHVTFESHCLDSFEHLKSFLKRFEAQPRVADYIKSDRHKKTPFFPPMAPWGNTPLLDH